MDQSSKGKKVRSLLNNDLEQGHLRNMCGSVSKLEQQREHVVLSSTTPILKRVYLHVETLISNLYWNWISLKLLDVLPCYSASN